MVKMIVNMEINNARAQIYNPTMSKDCRFYTCQWPDATILPFCNFGAVSTRESKYCKSRFRRGSTKMLRNGGGAYHWDLGGVPLDATKESQRGPEEPMGLWWRNL